MLLSSYNETNQVEDNALQIRYTISKHRIKENSGVGIQPYYLELNRYATKDYSFVGMTKEIAISCANEKVNKYTRTFRDDSDYDYFLSSGTLITYPSTKTDCQTSIQATRIDGGMWDVKIQVNETDTVLNPYNLLYPVSAYFDYISCDYDERYLNQ